MRRFRAINLIASCALVLLANYGDASSSVVQDALKKYLPVVLRNPLKELKTIPHGIVPGTLWCGPGHIAGNYSDLGRNRELDVCCREHDFCNDYIRPRSTKYGLYNSARFCRSSLCECDRRFYDCLKKAPGFFAFTVGKIYFKQCRKCFDTYYDIGTCMQRGLVVSEEQGRDGRRVFCAQFDRNPKWKQQGTGASSESTRTPAFPSRINAEPARTMPQFNPVDNDRPKDYENYDDEDESAENTDLNMLNIF
ncbi:PREDICTED: group 3 secretory phospholipase A2-like [Dinoponera quadriceps]|uniref:phospholipase A2 n=1 Tax=Dinoponera quadriceps TaxID=609295 RepID=A0A6P3XTK0_DINQU|nr:PREDICTED: group 3 secretory phospholipase A2-like [Dinoponera quadriceps]